MKAMLWAKVKLVVAATVVAGAICAGGVAVSMAVPSEADGSEVWVTGPSHKVLRAEKAPESEAIWSSGTKTVTLHAARNEFVSFQVVFPGPRAGVKPGMLELAGPQETKLTAKLFREHYLPHKAVSQYDGKTKVPDCVHMDKRRKEMGAAWEYPVQMVPVDAKQRGAPFDVAEDQNEVVWVDVFVPEKAPAGAYRGTLKAGGSSLKVALTVWNFTLPSVSHFPNWAYAGPENIAYSFKKPHTEIKNMMPAFDGYFQMSHDHRLGLMETLEYGPDYMKAADRKFHDYYTGTAFKGPFGAGFGYELLPLAGDGRGWMGLLGKEKWLNRAFFYLMDEPGSKGAYEEVVRKGRAVRQNTGGKAMRFVTEQFKPSRADWPNLDTEVDIFCSGGIPPSQVAHVESKGNVVWTYNGGHAGSPYTDSPGPAMRTHAWAGFVSGSRAWFFWEAVYVVDWQNKWRHVRSEIRKNPAKYRTDVWNVALNFDEATKRRGNGLYPAAWSLRLNGDGLLLYPGLDVGIDGPVACFRLKNIRRGTQDFEYLYLLEKMGRKELALAEAKKLLGDEDDSVSSRDGQSGKRKFNYDKDAAKWDAARLRLGKALHAIGEDALREKIKPYNQYPNPVGQPDYYSGERY